MSNNASAILNNMKKSEYNPTITEKIEILEYLQGLYKDNKKNGDKIMSTISTLTGWRATNNEPFFSKDIEAHEINEKFISKELLKLKIDDITKTSAAAIGKSATPLLSDYLTAKIAIDEKIKNKEQLALAEKIVILSSILHNFKHYRAITLDNEPLNRGKISELLREALNNYDSNVDSLSNVVKLSDDMRGKINIILDSQSEKLRFDGTLLERLGLLILSAAAIGGGVGLVMMIGGYFGVALTTFEAVIAGLGVGACVFGGLLIGAKAISPVNISGVEKDLSSLLSTESKSSSTFNPGNTVAVIKDTVNNDPSNSNVNSNESNGNDLDSGTSPGK